MKITFDPYDTVERCAVLGIIAGIEKEINDYHTVMSDQTLDVSSFRKAQLPEQPFTTPEPVKAATDANEVRVALTDFANTKGLPAASALLAEFGVQKATLLKEEQYGEFIGRIRDLSK